MIQQRQNDKKWDQLKERADQLGLGAAGVDAAKATGQVTPEQLADRFDAWEQQQGRNTVEREVLAEIDAQSGGDYELIQTAGGSDSARTSGAGAGSTPIQPVLNGNWDGAMNLAADPVGLLGPM